MAAMNVYGQPPHAQHVYLPSYYQGQMTYTRKLSVLCFCHSFTYHVPATFYIYTYVHIHIYAYISTRVRKLIPRIGSFILFYLSFLYISFTGLFINWIIGSIWYQKLHILDCCILNGGFGKIGRLTQFDDIKVV